MVASESDANPFLQGNFAPWRTEGSHERLDVVGRIPPELRGTYYRNGSNPAFEPPGRYHWFDGDGMIHALTLAEGRASYRNQYVESRGLLEERRAGRALYPGLLDLATADFLALKNTANTNIVWHAGKLLALQEASLPTEMRLRTLETVGEYDFGGRLLGAMTAHPKIDPETGEMLFFGYSPFPPYLQYHVAARDGSLVRSEAIDLAWPSMMHDFAVTAEHVIFLLFPLVFGFENLAQTGSALAWEPERGTRLGVMPRSGGSADVRWFETDACYVFHTMNAFTEGDEIVLDVARYPRMEFPWPTVARNPGDRDDGARLHRWRLDLRGGGVRSAPLDDATTEFPRIDERRLGRRTASGTSRPAARPPHTVVSSTSPRSGATMSSAARPKSGA